MDVGDEQIYRLRDYVRSEWVRIVAIDTRKKNPRYEIEFLDGDGGDKKDTQENVPGNRLRGPWSGVREYDELMANWERLDPFARVGRGSFSFAGEFAGALG